MDVEGGCCVEKGEEGYYYSAIRNKVAMGFPSSLSNPIGFPFEWKHPPFVRGVFLHLLRPPPYQLCLAVGEKGNQKKRSPFVVFVEDQSSCLSLLTCNSRSCGISFPLSIFPFNYLPAISSSEWMQGSFAHTRVEIAFWLVLPVLVTTWLVISF